MRSAAIPVYMTFPFSQASKRGRLAELTPMGLASFFSSPTFQTEKRTKQVLELNYKLIRLNEFIMGRRLSLRRHVLGPFY